MEIKVQPLHVRNIDDVLRIQRVAYSDNYHEDAASFAAKIVASPDTSCSAWREDVMVGYLIAVPMSSAEGFDLNSSNATSVSIADAQVMYIHDLAVDPEARGAGVADQLLHYVETAVSTSGISEWHLVSVQGSQGFWENRGFTLSPDPLPNGYGPEAVLMLRR